MNISVIGTGYVGLVIGSCLAEMGNHVICVDKNQQKLEKLRNGILPIFEPGLGELLKNNTKKNRIYFSDDVDFAVKNSQICFIAVGTPAQENGTPYMEDVFNVAKEIAKSINKYTIIINKSTVPVGTCQKVKEIIEKHTSYPFDVISNPEFLRQGAAVEDFLNPHRIILGTNSQKAITIMKELYSSFIKPETSFIIMDEKSAEMTKYASNSFLAVKISYINEIANICEKLGADIELVRQGMATDKRIGSQFLFPGIGYGGSCFPKDIKALINTAQNKDFTPFILTAAEKVNFNQKQIFISKIIEKFGENLNKKTFAIWGLSFKPHTNDMREAPSIVIIKELLNRGAKIQVFDPEAMKNAKDIFGNNITYCTNSYKPLENADALILLTEWNEFKYPDFVKIKKLLKTPIIIDGRNQYNPEQLKKYGIDYICIGRSPLQHQKI